MSEKLNLRQKLVQIYLELDHVDKAGENTKQHYNFVRAADVMRPIRAAFAKYGIYAQPNFELVGTYDIKTNNGGNMHTATVRVTIVLFDADSSETLVISGLGDGADGGDKGIFKAQTGALKNALRNGTLLPDEVIRTVVTPRPTKMWMPVSQAICQRKCLTSRKPSVGLQSRQQPRKRKSRLRPPNQAQKRPKRLPMPRTRLPQPPLLHRRLPRRLQSLWLPHRRPRLHRMWLLSMETPMRDPTRIVCRPRKN